MPLFDYTHTPDNPRALYDAYRHLRVDLYNGQTFYVDVHNYHNASLKGAKGTAAGLEEWPRLSLKLDKEWEKQRRPMRGVDRVLCVDDGVMCLEEPYSTVSFVRCFYGQQPPASFAKLLRMAVAVGHIAKDQRSLQEYCDLYLGVDCKGFAQSFIGGNIVGADLSRMGRFGTKITSIEQLRGHEIMIWNNFSHIAVLSSVVSFQLDPRTGAKSLIMEVVESSGSQRDRNGPAHGVELSRYQMDSDKSGIRVFRPYANFKGPNPSRELPENVTIYRFQRTGQPLPPAFHVSQRPSYPPLRVNW